MPRNNPSNEERRRIIRAYQRDEDFVLLANQLGIKRRTAYDIVNRFKNHGLIDRLPRSGNHNQKIDKEMQMCIRSNSFKSFNNIKRLKHPLAKLLTK